MTGLKTTGPRALRAPQPGEAFELTDRALSLEAQCRVAGSLWLVRTNSPAVLRSVKKTFAIAAGPGGTPDLSLRIAVDPDLKDRRPWPTPHFRGLDHFVYASYSPASSMLIDLLGRSVIGLVSPDMARDEEYWRYVLLPVLLGISSAAVGVTPLHCACLVKDRTGLLVGGASGMGKSTLAFSLAAQGFSFLSDDWTYFTRSGSGITAWGIPTVVKLLPDAVDHFPELSQLESRPSLNGELAYHVDPARRFGAEKPTHCGVGWIVFLERGGRRGGVAFRRISSEEAFSRFVSDLEMLPPCVADMRARQLETVKAIVSRPCWVASHLASPDVVAQEVARFCEAAPPPESHGDGW